MSEAKKLLKKFEYLGDGLQTVVGDIRTINTYLTNLGPALMGLERRIARLEGSDEESDDTGSGLIVPERFTH